MGTAFNTYHEARAEGQKRANETGMSVGLEIFTLGRTEYVIRYLPKKENRYGCDARCEVIDPEVIKPEPICAECERAAPHAPWCSKREAA